MKLLFEVIADQDGSIASLGLKLKGFAQAYGVDTAYIPWEEIRDFGDGGEHLDDAVDTINRRLSEHPGMCVGWHPDECGTLVFAEESWFDR